VFHLNFQANELKRKNTRKTTLDSNNSNEEFRVSKEMGENFAKQAVLANLHQVRATFANPKLHQEFSKLGMSGGARMS